MVPPGQEQWDILQGSIAGIEDTPSQTESLKNIELRFGFTISSFLFIMLVFLHKGW